jgi:hypothetical protein
MMMLQRIRCDAMIGSKECVGVVQSGREISSLVTMSSSDSSTSVGIEWDSLPGSALGKEECAEVEAPASGLLWAGWSLEGPEVDEGVKNIARPKWEGE